MKKLFALALMLCSTAAFAQDKPPPPTVGGKPLVQIKPKEAAASKEPKAKQEPKAKPQSVAVKL